jgi:DNA (cytosine-5)-methyltransferase 1
MRELSLFTGAGGGLLGTLLLGWQPVGYVEWDKYCQKVLAQRIKDGILPDAPIFGDIRTFISEGFARAYSGMVDVITGGFPCQPFSVAGQRKGAEDHRNMWPATIAAIRDIQPRYCLLENVPGLVTSGYFGTILGDLAQNGYDCSWRILSAAELGAPHKRDRLWLVAHTEHAKWGPGSASRCGMEGEHSLSQGQKNTAGAGSCSEDVAHTQSPRNNRSKQGHAQGERGRQSGHSPGQARSEWWAAEPPVGRMVNGLAHRMDRLRATGNGQVPAVAAAAWHMLNVWEHKEGGL